MSYTYNEPYSEVEPNTIRDDMWSLAHSMQHEDLVCLVSTYFTSDQLREFIDDRMMGRI
jgi:hypothetical protein